MEFRRRKIPFLNLVMRSTYLFKPLIVLQKAISMIAKGLPPSRSSAIYSVVYIAQARILVSAHRTFIGKMLGFIKTKLRSKQFHC